MENLLNVLQKLQDFNQHCDELLGNTTSTDKVDVLELVKKARKVDFNTISYARKSYLEMIELNNRCGLNINYQADYDISLEELQNKSITDLILDNPKERDEYWIVDFTKDFIKNIRKDIENDATFKYVEGQVIKVKKDDAKTIRKYAKKILKFRTEADEEFLKLLDSIIELEFDKECVGTPIIVEKSLKEDLLEEDYETLQSNFEYPIEELIEYNTYHIYSREYAENILVAVERLVDEGYTPSDIGLKVEDNWCDKISEFLLEQTLVEDEEFGFSELENKLEEEVFTSIMKEKKDKKREGKAAAVKDNAKKSITIKRISDGEILSFETKGECMKYLNTTFQTFSKFIKGQSKLNKKYIVLGD